MNSFLPDDYKKPSSGGSYTKLEKGENKIRILSAPIFGMVVWNEGKPHRFRQGDPVTVQPDQENGKVKHFWNVKVWNYNVEAVQLLEITQATIIDSLIAYSENTDFGTPLGYDVTIKKEGDGMETKYTVMASPPKELAKEIAQADKETPVNQEALYDGGDPFQVVEASTSVDDKNTTDSAKEVFGDV